jgi:hypothetical protein
MEGASSNSRNTRIRATTTMAAGLMSTAKKG